MRLTFVASKVLIPNCKFIIDQTRLHRMEFYVGLALCRVYTDYRLILSPLILSPSCEFCREELSRQGVQNTARKIQRDHILARATNTSDLLNDLRRIGCGCEIRDKADSGRDVSDRIKRGEETLALR